MKKNEILERCHAIQLQGYFSMMNINTNARTVSISFGHSPYLADASLYMFSDGSIDAPPRFWELLNEAELAVKEQAEIIKSSEKAVVKNTK